MYSNGRVPVDKGLGFDFSSIADIVKTALPVSLNIWNQNMQLKQLKSGVPFNPYMVPYGQQASQLPLASSFTTQPTFGNQYTYPSSGMSTTTMMLLGAAVLVAGLVAYKALR